MRVFNYSIYKKMIHFFCRHKYTSIRKNENEEERCVEPNRDKVFVSTGFGGSVTTPVRFYSVKVITEVFECQKCGKITKVTY